jgi:hypothetical protein
MKLSNSTTMISADLISIRFVLILRFCGLYADRELEI